MRLMTEFAGLAMGFAGQLVWVVISGALGVGLVFLQYHEYRRFRRLGLVRSWAIVKSSAVVLVPLALAPGLIAGSAVAGDKGLGALAVGLVLAPFAFLLLQLLAARLVRPPLSVSQGLLVGVSTLALLLVGPQALIGSVYTLGAFPSRMKAEADRANRERAFAQAVYGEALLEPVRTELFRLPDGQRLLHMIFQRGPVGEIEVLELQRLDSTETRRGWIKGPSNACYVGDRYHVYAVVQDAPGYVLRHFWYRDDPLSLHLASHEVSIGGFPAIDDTPFEVGVDSGEIRLPLPLPPFKIYLEFEPRDGRSTPSNQRLSTYARASNGGGQGERGPLCAGPRVTLPDALKKVTIEFYAQRAIQRPHRMPTNFLHYHYHPRPDVDVATVGSDTE